MNTKRQVAFSALHRPGQPRPFPRLDMAMARFGSQLVKWTGAKAQKIDPYKFYCIDDRVRKFLLIRPDRSFGELGIKSLHTTAHQLQQRFADGAMVDTTVGIGHANLHCDSVMLDALGYVWSRSELPKKVLKRIEEFLRKLRLHTSSRFVRFVWLSPSGPEVDELRAV